MRLFHVSEENDIQAFEPRIPSRKDLDQREGLIWSINEECLPNFLTPRDCPRVAYHTGDTTKDADKLKFFTSFQTYTIVIEGEWYERMRGTTLYLYEFNTADFELQDRNAGYYVAKKPQTPIAKHIVSDLFSELIKRNVEVRIVDNLWPIARSVQESTLCWSLCRMANARVEA